MGSYTVKCSNCGTEYETFRRVRGSNRCPECRYAFKIAHLFWRDKLIRYGRGDYSDVHARVDEAMERFAAKRKTEGKADMHECLGTYKKQKPKTKKLRGHCPYCGRPTAEDGVYCSRCVYEGLNLLHAATGRTSGWDKAGKAPVLVQDGLRGRAVMGGKTLRQRRDCL